MNSLRMAVRAACGLATVAYLASSPVSAQSNAEGSIAGSVMSSSGAVSDATVTIRSLDTGLTRSRSSADNGTYRFPALPTGTYEVTVTQPGYESRPVTVQVVVGESTPVDMMLFAGGEAIEEVLVQGQALTLDTTVAETSMVVTALELERLPIARDINAVALMAPNAVLGDAIFGGGGDKTRQHYSTNYGLASFGGASVAENAYYINGMNVTNFRNGLGGATLPFHFYDQFQVKTGGFGAEFGRSIGGVVNTVSKRGSNEWEVGGGLYFEPDSLRGEAPDVLDPTGASVYDSVYSFDELDREEIFGYFSGPLVEDKLFIYATYMDRNNDERNYTGASTVLADVDDDPFWGIKLDWNITDNHTLEYTGFSDESTTNRVTYDWDEQGTAFGAPVGTSRISRGGKNDILKYTGYFGENFSLSVLRGEGEYDLTSGGTADEACPAIYDSRQGGLTQIGCWTTFLPETGRDLREVTRIDAQMTIGDRHSLRFGMDAEDNTSINSNFYSGHTYYRYFASTPGETLSNGGIVPAGVNEVVRLRVLESGGQFKAESTAFYIEDEWLLSDNLTLRLGLRNETFDNRNALGDTFVKIDDQWAPRFGITWDIGGSGDSKLYATVGRYHIPVATNTNIRLSGAELFTEDWYPLVSLNADDTPVLGAQIGGTNVFGDGSVPDVRTVLDDTIEPMYQDEYIIGYERTMFRDYLGGVAFTYRDLGTYIDDVTIDEALNLPGEFHYVLTNPGTAMHTFYDADGDGIAEEYNLSAEQLGYEPGKRTYLGLTFYLDKVVSDRLYFRGSYVWSHSYGNTEGLVRSDNGQDDAGLTTLYDFPGLNEGAYGNLPNDRRHQIKFFANYQLTQNLTLNGSATWSSGRPLNAFGLHPNDPFAVLYGAESFFNQGSFTPRGSQGTSEDILNIDVGLTYQRPTRNGLLTARADFFNIFDLDSVIDTDEVADEESGTLSPTFGLPLRFQRPRTIRVGLQFDFGRTN